MIGQCAVAKDKVRMYNAATAAQQMKRSRTRTETHLVSATQFHQERHTEEFDCAARKLHSRWGCSIHV